MVTVIPEGDYSEFFGWAAPGTEEVQLLEDLHLEAHAPQGV
jgi:hypothetical protein